MEQLRIPLPTKCPCGGYPLSDAQDCDNVRTVNGETLAFCFARCAEEFDKRLEDAARLVC